MRDYWDVTYDLKRARECYLRAKNRGNEKLAAYWNENVEQYKEERSHLVKTGTDPRSKRYSKKRIVKKFNIYVNEMSDVKKFVPTAYTYVSICGRTSKNISWGSGHGTQLNGNGYRISGATHGRKGGE